MVVVPMVAAVQNTGQNGTHVWHHHCLFQSMAVVECQRYTDRSVASMASNEHVVRLSNVSHHTATATNTNISQHHLIMSSSMRAYIDSLPDKLSVKDEICSYQFWKCLRTEFIASFLCVVFGCSSLVTTTAKHNLAPSLQTVHLAANHAQVVMHNLTPTGEQVLNNSSLIEPSPIVELKSALALGLVVATLVQCTGHVSGCHLSVAVTIGLFVSGRVTPVRLTAYLLVQCVSACLGAIVVQCLFGSMPPITPASTLNPSQVFGVEFLATLLVVLTYLANCDVRRIDLGFKALSIGLAYTVAHLFALSSTGASLNPAKAFAASLITGIWCLHWIYWVSAFVAGLIGGLTYEYIGSVKSVPTNATSMACHCANLPRSATTELRHQFNEKPCPKSAVTANTTGTTGNLNLCSPETFSINETEFTITEQEPITRY